jgi:hypothetical protein
MSGKKEAPRVVKYTKFHYDSDANLIGQEDLYCRREIATAAIQIAVRFPVHSNAETARLLRAIAEQIESAKAKVRT